MRSEWSTLAKGLFSRREPGALLSLGLHVGTLVFALYSFSSAKPFDPATESVPVDVVTEKEFSDMMKGEKTAEKSPEPMRRVDRVAETKEDKDPGQAKKDVEAPSPKAAEMPPPKAEPEPVKPPPSAPKQMASIVPPPALRTLPVPPVKTPAAKPEEDEEEDDPQAEIIKQKQIKAAEEKKADEARKLEEKRKLDEKLKAEAAAEAQKQAAEAKAKADAKAKAEADAKAKAQAEAKQKLLEKLEAEEEAKEKAEEAKRVAEAKAKAAAEAKAKADAAAKAKAAADAKAKAVADAKAKADADANKLFASINSKLQVSREAPSSTGSTGAAVASRSSLGAPNASGKKLSPSDRAQLIGMLTEQMNRCISYSGSAPKNGPQITFTLQRDGSIAGGVQLANSGSEPSFRPFAEASMRALRNCQPYRIPARFLDTYDDWKNVRLNIDTSDMQ